MPSVTIFLSIEHSNAFFKFSINILLFSIAWSEESTITFAFSYLFLITEQANPIHGAVFLPKG